MILPGDSLGGGEFTLRTWAPGDDALLARAWADVEIERWTAVPDDRSTAAAARWIAGSEARHEQGTSLDRVIETDGGCAAGEIGLAPIDWDRDAAQVGYWLLPEYRGRGLASAALCLLSGWALTELALKLLVARCHPDNLASTAVASAAGYRLERADPEGFDLYVYRA